MDISKLAKFRRANRQKNTFSKIKKAMNGVPSRTANMVFDLTNRSVHKIDGNRNAHIKAMQLVSDLIGSFGVQARLKFSDLGMVKDAVSNDGVIQDGSVRVGVTLNTLMGHKANIDVPVIIRNRSLVEPAVFFYDGAPYVMCAPAIEQLVRKGSLQKNLMPRGIFQPPEGKESSSVDLPRTPIINYEHKFSPGNRNPWTFKRFSNKEAQYSGWSDVGSSEPSVHMYEKEFSLDAPDPELGLDSGGGHKVTIKQASDWVSTVINDSIEFAGFRASGNPVEDEQRAKKLFDDWLSDQNPEFADLGMMHEGQKKEPRKRTNIDVDTVFPELWTSTIPDHMLDPAERSRDGLLCYGCEVKLSENAEVRERGGGHLVLPSGEKGHVVRDEDGSGCMVYVHFPAMNLTAMLPSKMLKKAGKATVNQVKNEVRQMMREGYQKVDIQEAINRRYPEQADEALEGL